MSEENPLLGKIQMPGRRFRLPSRGLFYTDGELDENVENGEVEVLSMTAVDEISLRSPEFLFNGEAIDRVFKRCIPEVKKPLKLLARDVDYLLTALRVVSYGSTLEINLRCDECQKAQNQKNIREEEKFIEEVRVKAEEQEIDFNLAMKDAKVMEKLKNIRNKKSPRSLHRINLDGILTNQTKEMSDQEFKKYSFALSNGQHVKMTPLKMDSAVLSYQFQNEDLSADLDKAEEYVAFVMAACVLEVKTENNGDTITVKEPRHIAEWTKKLPIKLKQELAQKNELQDDWGTTFNYTLTCPVCDHKWDGNTLLNPITFFIIPSEQEDQNS